VTSNLLEQIDAATYAIRLHRMEIACAELRTARGVEHLRVEDDIKDLFDCISHYKPEIRDIETKLEPFIPDYIPAVGDIDAMIKIPRHDRVDLELGLEIVDEPCAAQSDPTVLDLHLRAISKTTSVKAVEVRQIKEPNENPKALDSWITSITDLHRDK